MNVKHIPLYVFWKVAFLVEVTPFRATSLGQLLMGVTLASETSLFYHLHQRFFRFPTQLPEYPNDFAEWAASSLGDALVAERLANLNLWRSTDLAVVRREISVILAEHLQQHGDRRTVRPEEAFIFCQMRGVRFRSGRQAQTPAEFLDVLRDIDSESIGYHLFVPKIAPGRVDNDFATWFAHLGYAPLAEQLNAFDPYLNSLEDNRSYMCELIAAGIGEPYGGEQR